MQVHDGDEREREKESGERGGKNAFSRRWLPCLSTGMGMPVALC